jgi:hypothetical protein
MSSDKQLIEAMALTYISHGGDSDGLYFIIRKLHERIKEMEESKCI